MVLMSDVFTLLCLAVVGLGYRHRSWFRRSKAVPPPFPAATKAAILDVIAEGWEPMSSRALFAKLGMPHGFVMAEYPLSSQALFTKLGMPDGFPIAPEPEPAQAQPAKEVSVDLPPEILCEEAPLEPWEVALAERLSA